MSEPGSIVIVSDPVGVAEIAKRARTSPGMVQQWRRRGNGFPAPAIVLAMGPIWRGYDVDRWLATHRPPGRPSRSALVQASPPRVPGRHI